MKLILSLANAKISTLTRSPNTIFYRSFIKKGPWEGLKSSNSSLSHKKRQVMISMAFSPLDGFGKILKYIVSWLIRSNLLCCKPSQVQMVERWNAAGSVLEIITVISMTEYKAVQPRAERAELSLWVNMLVPFRSSEWSRIESLKTTGIKI